MLLTLKAIQFPNHQAKYLASQSEQDFADQVWSYFATGTQLQEMYTQ